MNAKNLKREARLTCVEFAMTAICTTSLQIEAHVHCLGKQTRTKIKMPKRKANELGDVVLPDEPRRSSRRTSTTKGTENSKPVTTAAKKSKKTQKIEEEPLESKKDDKAKEESVSVNVIFAVFVCSARLPF